MASPYAGAIPHIKIKPEKLVNTAVGLLEAELVVPKLFTRAGIDQFKGAKNDTVTQRVPGVLPYHTYPWRNDRTDELVLDKYSETTVNVTFGNNVYSAVAMTDEQYDFDLFQWGEFLQVQAKAVARGLEAEAINTLKDAAYEVTIGVPEDYVGWRAVLIEARRVLNAMHAPAENRYVLIGSGIEAAILNDPTLTLAQFVGDDQASSALHSATLGALLGFTLVVDQSIDPNAAYAFAGSAFFFLTGAPSVPNSVPFGATTSFDGIAMRWMRDYDSMRLTDRSIVNTYSGFQTVKDSLITLDTATNEEVISTDQHLVRAVKIAVGADSSYPASGSDLAKAVPALGAGWTAPVAAGSGE